MGSRLYPLLNDRAWLRQKYEVEKLGTPEICRLAGAKTSNSVRQALIRFGFPIRDASEGLTCNREGDGFQINQEVLDGCLLGDAMLRKWNKESPISVPHFKKKNKYYDHVLYVAELLFPGRGQEVVRDECDVFRGVKRKYFSCRSLTHVALMSEYDRWYPAWSDYKKVVPKDIELTPTVLLHWFLDDGFSYLRKRDERWKGIRRLKPVEEQVRQIVVGFCSESFSKNDQERLCQQLRDRFDLKCRVRPYHDHGTGWRVELAQSSASDFFEIIGPPPVASLAYKWK